MSAVAEIRGNMARAIEESGLSVEDVARTADMPPDHLRWVLSDESGAFTIEDMYAVFVALNPDLPLTFHEWFREPEDATAP